MHHIALQTNKFSTEVSYPFGIGALLPKFSLILISKKLINKRSRWVNHSDIWTKSGKRWTRLHREHIESQKKEEYIKR